MSIFQFKSNNFAQKIEKVILSSKEDLLKIDITGLNLIEALHVAIELSTRSFLQNPAKKIVWQVRDYETKRAIMPLSLCNMELEIKMARQEERICAL